MFGTKLSPRTYIQKSALLCGLFFNSFFVPGVFAEVVTDGTVGPAQVLVGQPVGGGLSAFFITENLGTRAGPNLFHSFQRFNIASNEAAAFLGSPDIDNVISRVTGGQSSTINGLLFSNIGNQGFYFINPAGVMFGANARIDVPASFYVSTANELRFNDGLIFSASNTVASTLSIDQPESFGFLGDQTVTISVVQSNLVLTPGSTLSLSAGELEIDRSGLFSEAGEIHLTAVDAAGAVVMIGSDSVNGAVGNLIIDRTDLDVSGNGAGLISINAGDAIIASSDIFADNTGGDNAVDGAGINLSVNSLRLENALVTSDSFGPGNAGNVQVAVKDSLNIVDGGEFSSNAHFGGNAGNVIVQAGDITIDRQNSGFFTGIRSDGFTGSTGEAGDLRILVEDRLNIINGGRIFSRAFSVGNSGSVTVQAKNLDIDSQGSRFFTGIANQASEGSGDAGTVDIIVTDKLNITNGGIISNGTFSDGKGGAVTVVAGSLTIDRLGSQIFTGIASQANPGSTGNGGSVSVSVTDTLNIFNGGGISSSSFFSEGNAGTVSVKARNLNINSEDLRVANGILSTARGNSNSAGNISVSVTDSLNLLNGGVISSSSISNGNGGAVSVQAKHLIIDGRDSGLPTVISSQANTGSGSAGSVDIMVSDTVGVFNGGIISSSTFADGDAGTVSVQTENLVIDSQQSVFFTGITTLAGRGAGNGGSVAVLAKGALNIFNGGAISSDTFAEGNAGPVVVQAKSSTIDGQGSPTFTGISSQANPGSSGDGGSVAVSVTDTLEILNGGKISSSTFSDGSAGEVTVQGGVLIVDGQGSDLFTGIESDSELGSSGQSGNVLIAAKNIRLIDGGAVSIESSATLDSTALASIKPTEINISARNLSLTDSFISTESFGNVPAGSIVLNVTDTLSLDPSSITTAANNADGGAITINANIIDLEDSQITTSVAGQGNGGNIDLNANVLVLDTGFIQANTEGVNATGGDIRIDTGSLVASQNILISGGDTPLTFRPGLNVIQAAAPDGVSGTINITSPQLDISGDLTDLEVALLDPDTLVQNPCATPGGWQSSLSSLGPGGLPDSPADARSVPLHPERLNRLLRVTDDLLRQHPPESEGKRPNSGDTDIEKLKSEAWRVTQATTGCRSM